MCLMLPLLLYIKPSTNPVYVGTFGLVVLCLYYTSQGFVTDGTVFFGTPLLFVLNCQSVAVIVLDSIGSISAPISRGILSKSISEHQQGTLFATINAVEVCSSNMYETHTLLYRPVSTCLCLLCFRKSMRLQRQVFPNYAGLYALSAFLDSLLFTIIVHAFLLGRLRSHCCKFSNLKLSIAFIINASAPETDSDVFCSAFYTHIHKSRMRRDAGSITGRAQGLDKRL